MTPAGGTRRPCRWRPRRPAVPTLPGTSAHDAVGATAPASINSGGAMPPAPTGMAPAGATSGTGGAAGAGSRGASGIGAMAGLGGAVGGRIGGPGAGGAGGVGNGAATRARSGFGTGGHPVAGSGKTPSTTAVARTDLSGRLRRARRRQAEWRHRRALGVTATAHRGETTSDIRCRTRLR